MKTKHKELQPVNFYHPKADALFDKELPILSKAVESFAVDMANQGRPNKQDSPMLFVPKIKGLFEAFLEQVLKIIGALAVINDNGSHIKQTYAKEEEQLVKHKAELIEDKRVLVKEIKHLPQNLTHRITKWRKWQLILLGLCGAETLINWKILLILTPNAISALGASVGIAVSLFLISHSMKDIVFYFDSKMKQWLAGLSVTALVVFLLYGFATLRKVFLSDFDDGTSQDISPWIFVAVNFVMWLAGTLIALIYKPLRKTVNDFKRYKIVKDQIRKAEQQLSEINDRLDAIPMECSQKLIDLKNLRYMGEHYANLISSHYRSSVAQFKAENLLRRKDGISPDSFLEKPEPLSNYFKTNQNTSKH
ncbi:hypothetical protein [uncultured Lacinutrix sp.]|uniref:hypothetical protein n=1 Tax=uncultured Lacinutrix sp. TaxID=574032 RepID=UPI00262A5067|nr:hypothetical protein [uncultured Lacinutrix sp.]